jgi:hypothetical protein
MGQPSTQYTAGFGLKPKQVIANELELGPAGVPIPQAAGLPGADTDPTLCRLLFLNGFEARFETLPIAHIA